MLALARALPPDGRMICIEGDRAAAARATRQFADQGLSGRVSIMIGDPALFVRKVAGPFDLIVIAGDASVQDRIAAHVPRLSAPGARVEHGWPGRDD